MTKRGKFIVFEGIDGSGKSTVANKIFKRLNELDISTHKTFEPTDSPIGSVIRNILNKRIVADEKTIGALFLADRLDHIQNNANGMLKFLNEGTNVISDRYYYSSYAYHVPHLSLDWVIAANKVCADLLRPDIVFFLDITPEVSMERLNKNRKFHDLFETKERITQVYHNYKAAIKKEGDKDNVVIIDANRPADEVFESAWSETLSLLQKK
jgi:dTMP kinase